MTNKEYIMITFPERLSSTAIGGVIGCPEDYNLANTLRPQNNGKYEICIHGNCEKCWNLKYEQKTKCQKERKHTND